MLQLLEPNEKEIQEELNTILSGLPVIDIEKEHEQGNYVINSDKLEAFYEVLKPYITKANKNNIPYELNELYRGRVGDEVYFVIRFKLDIKLDKWIFAATIEHTPNGNIIRNISGMDLPMKYREVGPTTCDHCKSTRYRKNTYVVYNTELKEYKQVGKSCLKVYTGIDVSRFASFFDIDLESYETPSNGSDPDSFDFSKAITTESYPLKDILNASYELITKFGYIKTSRENSTKDRFLTFTKYLQGKYSKYPRLEAILARTIKLNDIQFDRPEAIDTTERALQWLDAQNDNQEYIYNLKVITSSENIALKNIGYVISLMSTYLKEEAQININKMIKSEYQGSIGDKLEFKVDEFKCATSFETMYGINYVYTFKDTQGNVYTWKTSNSFGSDIIDSIKGTVKTHKEYKGLKQTELTRCRVKTIKIEE